ncbi:MAG TPA: hypothetical protein VL068_10160 [Microthrixaceae bacterium]|nr:hypothetical protein [Microthrixaceae bacterium]
MGLPEKIVAIHESLETARIAHAFGGALALAWCTKRARGTIDIDLNVFVDPDSAEIVFASLPDGIVWSAQDLESVHSDGQVRLWWDTTPVDIFLNTTGFHREVANRARSELFMGQEVPFLSCTDLAVFKAFFNRTKDWADIEEMIAAGTLDVERVVGVLVTYLGNTDERVDRLLGLI